MITGRRGRNAPRTVALAASLAVVTLTLGGCSFVDDAGQAWGILQSDAAPKQALSDAVSTLKGIDGVESASSTFVAAGASGVEAALHVIASASIAEESLSEIATITRESFGGSELENTVPTLTLRFGDGADDGVLTQRYPELSDEQFIAEIAYWRSAEVAIEAELSLTLTPSPEGGAYVRTINAPEDADAVGTAEHVIENFEALAAVHDETKIPTSWDFSGIRSFPILPPADLVGALNDIRTIIPLIDYSTVPETPTADFEYPEGVLMMWNLPALEGPVVAEIWMSQREFREADWKNALGAAITAGQIADLNIRYGAGEQQFQLHTSPCVGTINESSDDQKFFDAALAGGAQFLAGAGPGACIPEQ